MSNKKRRVRRRPRPEDLPRVELVVYVMDTETRSSVTIANLKSLCQQHAPGKYQIQIIDVLKSPERCSQDQILALPTVVRRFPLPERRVVGTLADGRLAAAALELGPVN